MGFSVLLRCQCGLIFAMLPANLTLLTYQRSGLCCMKRVVCSRLQDATTTAVLQSHPLYHMFRKLPPATPPNMDPEALFAEVL